MAASRPGFSGFPEEGLNFLRALAKNNRREWFQPRKQIYDGRVKAPMIDLVNALNAAMMEFAPLHVADPGKAIYRIYRDTRFSKDKTPYKTHIAAVFPHRRLPKSAGAGYYFSVSPTEIEIGGGIYMPAPDELLAIRTHLAARHEEFLVTIAAREVKRLFGELRGEQLSRVPKGFAAAHPAADLLRRKQLLLLVTLDPALAASPKLLPELVKRFRAMAPFIEFLNAPLIRSGPVSPRLE